MIVTVGSAASVSTVDTFIVRRPFVIAVSVDTASLGPSLSIGIISLSGDGNSVRSDTAPALIVISLAVVGISSKVRYTVLAYEFSSSSVRSGSSNITAEIAAWPLIIKRVSSISDSLIGSDHLIRTLFSTLSTIVSEVSSYAPPSTSSTTLGGAVSTVYLWNWSPAVASESDWRTFEARSVAVTYQFTSPSGLIAGSSATAFQP